MIQLTTTVSNCATFSSSFLDLGRSLSHSSDLPELVEGSARRSSLLDNPNVREGLDVEGASLESSRSRRRDEKYPGPNEDPNCPLPTLFFAETSCGRLDARSLEPGIELCSTLCEISSCSSSSSASSTSIGSDLCVPLKKSTSHAGEKKSLTVSITPCNATDKERWLFSYGEVLALCKFNVKTSSSAIGKQPIYKLEVTGYSVLNEVRLAYLLSPRWTGIRFRRLSLSCIPPDFVGARAASTRLVHHC